MRHKPEIRFNGRSGFTLTEVLMASSVSLVIVTIALNVYIGVIRSWRGIDRRMQADRDVNAAVSHMIYGVEERRGMRTASDVTLDNDNEGWTVTYITGGASPETNSFTYSNEEQTLVFNPGAKVVCRDLSVAAINLQSHSLTVTMRVDRVEGNCAVQREVGTRISWRN